jgi:hypothetical protein
MSRLNLTALLILAPINIGAGHFNTGDEQELAKVLDRQSAEDAVRLGCLHAAVLQDPDEVAEELERRENAEVEAEVLELANHAAIVDVPPDEG